MTTLEVPDNPFALVEPRPLGLAGRREAEVFGAPVSVLCLPHRAGRAGMPGAGRAAFQTSRADAIVAAEAVWRGPGMAITGNRYPFAEDQIILWATEGRREPSPAMLEAAFRIEDATDGTSMVNSIGAAGSLTRSHVHVIGEQPPFLAALSRSPLDPAAVHLAPDQVRDCGLWKLDPPFPGIAVGISGSAPARAAAMHHLLEARTALAFNLIGNGGIAWLVPRSADEITAPHFPQALGGAELAGLWCVNDPEVFARMTGAGMEAALRMGCLPWTE